MQAAGDVRRCAMSGIACSFVRMYAINCVSQVKLKVRYYFEPTKSTCSFLFRETARGVLLANSSSFLWLANSTRSLSTSSSVYLELVHAAKVEEDHSSSSFAHHNVSGSEEGARR